MDTDWTVETYKIDNMATHSETEMCKLSCVKNDRNQSVAIGFNEAGFMYLSHTFDTQTASSGGFATLAVEHMRDTARRKFESEGKVGVCGLHALAPLEELETAFGDRVGEFAIDGKRFVLDESGLHLYSYHNEHVFSIERENPVLNEWIEGIEAILYKSDVLSQV